MKDYKPDDWSEYPKPGYRPKMWMVAVGIAIWVVCLAAGGFVAWCVGR